MTNLGKMNVTRVNVTLNPLSIQLDESGRILFINPEILEALVVATPGEIIAEGVENKSQCACNLSNCGGSGAESLQPRILPE